MKRTLMTGAAIAVGAALAAPGALAATDKAADTATGHKAMTPLETLEARLGGDFKAIDRNGDGQISSGEFARIDEATRRYVLYELPAAPFVELDRNGDGIVSRSEYMTAGKQAFDRLDASAQDAAISRARERGRAVDDAAS